MPWIINHGVEALVRHAQCDLCPAVTMLLHTASTKHAAQATSDTAQDYITLLKMLIHLGAMSAKSALITVA